MILIDTNVFIYIANGSLNPKIIAGHDIAFASVSKIEALGFHKLVVQEESRLQTIFHKAEYLGLSDDIVEIAISLRKAKSMSLGDSIIAATALHHSLELWTVNTEDFEHVSELKLHNPLKEVSIEP